MQFDKRIQNDFSLRRTVDHDLRDPCNFAGEPGLKANLLYGAAQLAQHVIRLEPQDPAPKLLMADALAIIGERSFNAPARNYTLSFSNRLRRQARGEQ